MRSYNPTYGLWNDGEDEVKSRNKKGAEVLDKDEFVGILHKTGNETDPNLYLMKNYYYVADDIGNVIGCLFRASHVKKITNLDIEVKGGAE